MLDCCKCRYGARRDFCQDSDCYACKLNLNLGVDLDPLCRCTPVGIDEKCECHEDKDV